MPFLCAASSIALATIFWIGFLFMPVVLEVEMALETFGSVVTKAAIPSIILLSEGLTKIIAENDFRQCKKKIIEASEYVFQMKMELSNVIQMDDCLEIPMDIQDIYDLKPIYENLMENIQDIRDICSKPFSV
ncbi:unnamed protein product [Rotaria sordida]|nr:unnamed protein product [Rotaria sordida]